MEKNERQFRGVTLTELLVALAVIASLIALSMPARRLLQSSFETTGTKAMISAALATARAIAAKEQHYAGVRFQQDPNGNQYMVFILHDRDNLDLANGFRAVEGLKPLKLPEATGVMDLRLGLDPNQPINDDSYINDPCELTDTTTFSVVFSPTGKLLIHDVRVQRENAQDFVFNTTLNVNAGNAMFVEDSGGTAPWQQELSRKSFVIYDRTNFKPAYEEGTAWEKYLRWLQPIYINPYTGTIIVE